MGEVFRVNGFCDSSSKKLERQFFRYTKLRSGGAWTPFSFWSPRRQRRPTGRIHRNAPKRTAGGDEERLPVRAPKSEVGHFVHRYRNEIEQLAFRRNDINAPFELVDGFVWWVRLVQTGCHVQTAGLVHFDAVRTSAS